MVIAMHRRRFLQYSAAAVAAPALVGRVQAQTVAGATLPIPPLMDVGEDAGNLLEAVAGRHRFAENFEAETLGWSQDNLGPTLRMRRGRSARLTARNRLDSPISAHWHGLHVPGWQDGGPQSLIAPGQELEQKLEIDQPAGTFWYHSHPHGSTGYQVYSGLAGMLLIEDDDKASNSLPLDYGVDDIPLVIQDKSFSSRGTLEYDRDGMAAMQGFRGDRISVNGALAPKARVPQGVVRFRLLNASNSRVYALRFNNNRSFHQIGSDAGLLPAPVERRKLQLAPAERAEILVDFSNGADARMVSEDVPAEMMGGMMAGGSGTATRDGAFRVLDIEVDHSRTGAIKALACPHRVVRFNC